MTENISINIKPDELKKILLDYYKKLYNDESIKFFFISKEELVGYYEDKKLTTTVNMERKIKIGKETGTITYELNKKDIIDALNNSINDNNFEIIDISLKTEKEYYNGNYGDYIELKELQAILKRKEKVKQKIKEK